jgi:16S rRNA (guanine527-N7)-methyltransferase
MSDPFDTLRERADRIDVDLSDAQAATLRRHFDLLVEANRSVNLTRVTDPEEAVAKLYLSSLAVGPALGEMGIIIEGLFTGLDLGTGAGFPGIPLAVAWPQLETTLVDARRKKVDFLTGAIEELGLRHVRAVHARGAELERVIPHSRASFDLVTARAVATAAEVIEETRDLLAPGGCLVIHKGPNLTGKEIAAGRKAAHRAAFTFLGVAEPKVEDLSPRLLVYRARTAADEGEAPRE